MRRLAVRVQPDHLERITRGRKPLLALAELVWNALDADAREVSVDLEKNVLGGLKAISVSDDGHGIEYDEAIPAFENLGGSSKRARRRSRREGRILHGKLGKGRFRAFSLGTYVEWATRYPSNGSIKQYRIRGSREDLSTFEIEDPTGSDETATGTRVTITGIDRGFPTIVGRTAFQEFTAHFALYLRQYPDLHIWYDGQKIDPALVEKAVTDYPLEPVHLEGGSVIEAELTIIEWNTPAERALFLCDRSGFALGETVPGVVAPGFNFTAYLKSEFIRELDDDNALMLETLHPDLRRLIEPARAKLREHFRRRAAEAASSLVEEWKREEVYPYKGEPNTPLETAERQVFDICAVSVSSYLPDFEQSDRRTKKFSFQLLRQALEESPEDLLRILEDVVGLPKDKQAELAQLLEKTSLSAVISAAKLVADRLDFLRGLELLVFDPESKERLLERRQLQRILVDHTWLFGEEFNLTVDDQSLTEVLRKHLRLLGRSPTVEEPVLREDGSGGRVDVMLSRLVPQPKADEREHLIAELKRPSQVIDQEVISQIKSYAFAVADDERFRDTKTRWVFWVISNAMSDSVRREARQRNRAEGLLYDDEEGRITIWVKTWGQLINDCKARLTFFQKHLQYEADRGSALEYLRRAHEKFLPKVLLEDPANELADPMVPGQAAGND